MNTHHNLRLINTPIKDLIETQQEYSKNLLHREIISFEENLRKSVNTVKCVAVPSGINGILLALTAVGTEAGDNVLCSGFSFFAAGPMLNLIGANPVFVDINPNSYNIDPYCLEYTLHKCKRTNIKKPKAIIVSNMFGLPFEYDAIKEICDKHGISIIEDMFQSFGAKFKDYNAGRLGRFSVASFSGNMNSDGGAVFCNYAEDSQKIDTLKIKHKLFKKNITCTQAGIAMCKFEAVLQGIEKRKKIADIYSENLANHVRLQVVPKHSVSANTHFAVSFSSAQERDKVYKLLKDKDIPIQKFVPSHLDTGKTKLTPKVTLVNSKTASEKLLLLPIHHYMSKNSIQYICKFILPNQK